jgi:hypothetical protein
MRHHLRVLRSCSIVSSLAGLLFAAAVAGCDSGVGPAADSPEVKAQQAAARQKIEEQDAKNTADLKKKYKNAPTLKTMTKPGAVGQ